MDIQSHILSSFNEDLITLQNHLVEMVTQVEGSLIRVEEAIIQNDRGICADVVADDDIIDGAERIIDRMAMDILDIRYRRINVVANDVFKDAESSRRAKQI